MRGCADADAKPGSLNLETVAIARAPAVRPAPDVTARAVTASQCLAARRGIANPPLPALGGLFIVISKRDPAPSFNRIIHFDS
jgi:hypothetical protein